MPVFPGVSQIEAFYRGEVNSDTFLENISSFIYLLQPSTKKDLTFTTWRERYSYKVSHYMFTEPLKTLKNEFMGLLLTKIG